MTGIILIALLNVAMFGWFYYLAVKDPANLWKRRRFRREDDEEKPQD